MNFDLLKHVERPYCILKGTVLQLQKSADISLQIIKLVYQRFHSITPFISRDMCNKQKLVTHGMLSVILKMFLYSHLLFMFMEGVHLPER